MRRSRKDEGAAAVEFALVLPVLILILFGIIAFGIVFAQQLALNSGARQGARAGVVGDKTCADIASTAKSAAQSIGINPANITVATTVGGSGCSGAAKPCLSHRGDPVKVVVSYPGSISIPLFGNLTPTLKGTGEYRCEANE